MLVGTNVFFDHEWENRHSRIGFGAEARWASFDLYANYYNSISNTRTVAADTFETAMDGYDVELTAQIPYLLWARLRGRYLHFDSEFQANNVDGFSASLEMEMHQNLEFEFGYSEDDVRRDGFMFVKLRFRLANPKSPVLACNLLFDNQAYRWRDMRDHTLDKVHRDNTITIERTITGSV